MLQVSFWWEAVEESSHEPSRTERSCRDIIYDACNEEAWLNQRRGRGTLSSRAYIVSSEQHKLSRDKYKRD